MYISIQSANDSEIDLITILEPEGNFLLINHIISQIKRLVQKQVKPRSPTESCRWTEPINVFATPPSLAAVPASPPCQRLLQHLGWNFPKHGLWEVTLHRGGLH